MLCGRSAESAPGGVERESKPSRDALFGLERETIEGCVAPGGVTESGERESGEAEVAVGCSANGYRLEPTKVPPRAGRARAGGVSPPHTDHVWLWSFGMLN